MPKENYLTCNYYNAYIQKKVRWPRKAKHNKKFVKTQQEICPKHNNKFAKTQQQIC